jgi:hypothetical protein
MNAILLAFPKKSCIFAGKIKNLGVPCGQAIGTMVTGYWLNPYNQGLRPICNPKINFN